MEPPVFVVGCGRSGTTLLRLMLDAHPDLAIPPESHFLSRLGHNLNRYRSSGRLDAERLVRDILRTKTFQLWGVDDDQVWKRVGALPEGPSFAQVIDAVYRAYSEPRGAGGWGDKTPRYVLDIPMFAGLFPRSRFVHIIRDGRDVAMSLRTVRFGPNEPMGAAIFWQRRVRAGMRAGASLGADRYREVRYESLVQDAERELRGILGFLDLPWKPEVLRYHERTADSLPQSRRDQHPNEARSPTPGLRDWRHQMAPRDVAAFEAIAGPLLVELGYGLGAPPAGALLRTRSRVHRLKIAARQRVHASLRRGRQRERADDDD